MTDGNPMTQPLSPIEREAKLVAARNVCEAFLALLDNGAPNLTDTDVNDIAQMAGEIEIKWIDLLLPFYDKRLTSTTPLDADTQGVDYTLANNIAQIAATLLVGKTMPLDNVSRAAAIGEAMILQKMAYDAVQATDDPPTTVPVG